MRWQHHELQLELRGRLERHGRDREPHLCGAGTFTTVLTVTDNRARRAAHAHPDGHAGRRRERHGQRSHQLSSACRSPVAEGGLSSPHLRSAAARSGGRAAAPSNSEVLATTATDVSGNYSLTGRQHRRVRAREGAVALRGYGGATGRLGPAGAQQHNGNALYVSTGLCSTAARPTRRATSGRRLAGAATLRVFIRVCGPRRRLLSSTRCIRCAVRDRAR